MTPAQIEESLKDIQEAIEVMPSQEDIDGVQAKLCELAGYLGLSAELIRFSTAVKLKKQGDVLSKLNLKDYSPTIAKQLVESELFYESSICDYANRINSALVHSIDAMRSIVSLYGKELESQTKTFSTTT